MKKLLLAGLIATGLSANAQRTTSGAQKIPAKKTNSAPAKIIVPILKSLESLSDIQIANALFVEIGLDDYGGPNDDILKSYIKSSAKVVNVAEIIHNKRIYYLVDRLDGNDIPDGSNRGSYEDKGNIRSTVANSPYSADNGSGRINLRSIVANSLYSGNNGSNPWISHLNQEEVNKFRVSSRGKAPIELVASDISVMCQKEGNSFMEVLQIGDDLVSQYFIKGMHSYIISVDRSGEVTSISSKDLIDNNQASDNYNICSERLIAKIKDFKFSDDLDAPASRTYEVTIKATVKGTNLKVAKFVYNNKSYLSDSDTSRKFYTDSIRIVSRMNDVMKDLKLVESRRDSIRKSLAKNREDILEEFQINYDAHVEKDKQRLLTEEWGGKLDPRANSYESKLEMIQAQAKANTNENFRNLQISSKRDFIDGMESINEEYDRVVNIYNDLQSEYESLEK